MDVLSDVLRGIRLTGSVFLGARFTAPWALESGGDHVTRFVFPQAERIALFHIVVEGSVWVTLSGQAPLCLEAGDAILFPHNDLHTMGSDPRLPPRSLDGAMPPAPLNEMPQIEFGGGGEVTRVLCGYLRCDQHFNPLMASLPKLLWVKHASGEVADGATQIRQGKRGESAQSASSTWLPLTLRHMVQEAAEARPGNATMLARLAELLFVEVLRRYIQQRPPGHSGWLAGVRDPEVGRALGYLHAEPGRAWTVDELARNVALSRSALAQRFGSLVGEPPMRYLAGWRLQVARQLLSQPGGMGIAEVASRVGYDSEAAFNRAFKRHVGLPPATWRRQNQ
jgi:AraC-like DNA-binding protein